MTDPKDGFDLLEYPCDFQFKAMVKVSGLSEGQSPVMAMQSLLENSAVAGELKDSSSTASRTGKFESVSLTLRLEDREQLEAIYALLANDPNVVMTL